MGPDEVINEKNFQAKTASNIIVENCASIFLWPFYQANEHGQRIRNPENVRLPQPWNRVEDDDSIWEHYRATEYFDPQALGAVYREYKSSDFNVIYDEESGDSHNWQVEPAITVFESGICVLSLKVTPTSRITLAHLLNFNERFRYTSLMAFQRGSQPNKYRYRVCWSSIWDKQDAYYGHSGELCESIVDERSKACLPGFQKMICCTAVMANGVGNEDRYRLTAIDEEDDENKALPNPAYWRELRGAVRYDRWDPDQFFGFTNYSMCWLLDDSRDKIPGFLKPDGFITHMSKLYAGVIGQSIAHQLGALSVFSRELAELEPNCIGYAVGVKNLRHDVLSFINNAWYDRVTFEVQGHEMYTAWRDAIEVESLFAEVQRELQDTDEWLSMEQSNLMNRNLFVIQYVLAFVGGAGLGLTTMIARPSFLPKAWLDWPWLLPLGSAVVGITADIACLILKSLPNVFERIRGGGGRH